MRDERKQPAPVEPGEILTVPVESFPLGPDAIARANGYVLFVPGAIPGERVRVRVTDVGRRHGRGTILDVVAASGDRVEPFCPLFLECGGCHLQHLSDESRRRAKRSLLARTLDHALGREVPVAPLAAGPTRRYRDKVALALAPDRRGGILAGFYKARTRDLVPIEDCPVQAEGATRLALALVERLVSVGATAWDADREQGDVRAVLVREGAGTGELYGVVVARHDRLPWLERFLEAAKDVRAIGLALNVSPPRERDFVLGPETRVLRGPARYRTTIEGLTFQVSPTSFFQTNASGAAAVVRAVLAGLGDVKNRRVLDVYGGVGLIGLHVAKRGGRALVVEGNPASIADGRASAEAAGLKASFRRGRAEDVVPRLAREGSRFDAVVLDPPREGCHPRVLDVVGRTLESSVVSYVSCDPESLGRDLSVLTRHGYGIAAVTPIDMFPHAYHLEAVATLYRER